MAHLTQSGRFCGGFLLLFLCSSSIASAQSSPLVCNASAVPALVRAEGVTERVGDILLQCSGGTAGTVVSGNLSVFLPVNITNRVDAGQMAAGTALVVETGDAPAIAFSGRVANQSITFNGIQFTVPAGGQVRMRITNLRANVNQLGIAGEPVVEAHLAHSLSQATLVNNPVTVARTAASLSATTAPSGIPAAASPAPEEPGIASLFAAGTRFTSTRLTEILPEAFQTRDETTDTGTRLMVRYSDVPSCARLFVPDVVAGSDAVVPTAGGDLGGTPSGGEYETGSGTLLLARVLSPNPDGSGGTLAYTPGQDGPGTVSFDGAREVAVSGGAGMVVYEVVDANPTRLQSAQFPTFVSASGCGLTGIIRQAVTYAPLSSAPAASMEAPVPRFAAVEPPSDCPALGDCDSSFFPRLRVNAVDLDFRAPAGGKPARHGYIAVKNTAGGLLSWTATVEYQNGEGWLNLNPNSGLNNRSIFARASAQDLAPGIYRATINIDAGPLTGGVSLPVTFTVADPTAPPEPPPGTPFISAVVNAADFQTATVVAGSLASLVGKNLAGENVAVTFDGLEAGLLYAGEEQLNVLVPAALAGKASAQVVVRVDGKSSAPATATLAPFAPAIFANGILNQDNSPNGPGNPAAPGSVIQVWLTGLAEPQRWFDAAVTVKIHDRDQLPPQYAGEAPGLEGVQQVNVAIPEGLPAMTTDLVICAGTVCSPPVRVSLGQ